MTKANECTCPSGDGSLRHPCPAHPASVELAGVGAKLTFINGRPAMCGCQVEYSSGGGEYSDVIDVTLCAKHSGSAILDLVATNRIALTPEYEGQWHADLYLDREIPLAKAEGATPAEAVLALMSAERIDPEQESVEQAGGDERAAFEAAASKLGIYTCNFERYTEETAAHENRINARVEDPVRAGDYRSATLQDCWKVWQEARAALAQPSTKCATCNGSGFVEFERGAVIKDCPRCHRVAQPSPAPELAERGTQHRFSTTEQTCRHDFAGVWWNDNGVTQTGHECRHCGFFVADVTEASAEQAEAERPEGTADFLAIVREAVAGAYNEWKMTSEAVTEIMEAHERIVGALRFERQQMDRAFTACINERDAALARVAEWRAGIARAIERASVFDDGSDGADAESARSVVAILSELLAQAQHSVPVTHEFKRALGLVVAALEADGDRPTSKYALSKLKKVLAAAPGKEGV
ncbi:TPA: hypothetical protein NHL12_000691 [Pseudomonas aeruginosa]|nr:hypothetical protein [Pseudomonas aeruginosa]